MHSVHCIVCIKYIRQQQHLPFDVAQIRTGNLKRTGNGERGTRNGGLIGLSIELLLKVLPTKQFLLFGVSLQSSINVGETLFRMTHE